MSRRPGRHDANRSRHAPGQSGAKDPASEWVFGTHAALAALSNPRREIRRIVASHQSAPAWREKVAARGLKLEETSPEAMTQLLGRDTVHQGIAVFAGPPAETSLEDMIDEAPRKDALLVVLDQVTDPHNVGAILRSAAAFGASGLIMQDRHAPPLNGTVAKAASGGADLVPVARVVNIARTLEELKQAGFTVIGLAGETDKPLKDLVPEGPVALVLGAEGPGLRRLVREQCDALARIDMAPAMESLNVSNAAAIALYELRRGKRLR
ncbi:MAG: 23S rRNA (guanosine(2251)-2'-O)-methyltransferase RlmB [Alphaproteobacteria bacterium]|nr:23S rRNA (guanosine(2251)-2'-O)-methyltransferase RlmB [Alphaproteobacteria bacterium]